MVERDVETTIDKQLDVLGWIDDPSLPNRNVYKQSVKTKEQKRALGNRRPDYVLYKENTNEPLIVIEVKRSNKNISDALIQGEEYAKAINAPIVIATNGIAVKTLHIVKQKPLVLNKEEVTKLINHSLAVEYVNTNEWFTVDEKIIKSREELLVIFKDINKQFRDAGVSTGLPRIELFCNLLFLKVITELSESNSLITTLPEWCKWDKIKQKKGDELQGFINNQAFEHFRIAYGGDVLSPIEDLVKANILDVIVEKLDDLHLSSTNTDVKGDAFEYFLRNYGGADTDFGEYFTPRHIVKALVQLLNPQFGESIYDPFCGTGGMLIEAYKHIWESKWARTSENVEFLKERTIYGGEITKMYRIAKMNMILAGDGHSNIVRQDSYATPDTIKQIEVIEEGIKSKKDKIVKYDVVITNMPFGNKMKTEYSGLYGFDTLSAEVTGVLHCLRALGDNENSRIGIIVPEGILFNSTKAYKSLRELIIRDYELETVVSLPQQSFAPNTGVKSDILIIKKHRQSDKKHVWYFNVKNDGYTLNTARRRIDGINDIDNLLAETELTELSEEEQSRLKKLGFGVLDKDEISKNDFKFLPKLKQPKYSCKYPIVKLGDVCYIQTGGTPKTDVSEYWENGNIPWLSSTDCKNNVILKSDKRITQMGLQNSSAKMIKLNSTLIALVGKGTAGRVAYLTFEAATNQNVASIYPIDTHKLDEKYLFYVTQNLYKDFDELCSNGYKMANLSFVKSRCIPLPPIDIQKNIVSELDGYKRIIDSSKSVIESYAPNIKIESTWEIKKIAELCDINLESVNPINSVKDEFVYIDISSIENFTGFIDKSKLIKKENAPSRARRLFEKGDILISTVRPNLKAIGYVDFDSSNYIASTGLSVLRPKSIEGKYLYYILFDKHVSDQLSSKMDKGLYPSVTKNDILGLNIPVPNAETQKQIVEEIEQEKRLIETSHKTIELFTKKLNDRISDIWNMG